MRLDLHVHSRFSPDSKTPLEAILDHLGVAGLQGFALTDHNTVGGHARLRELAARHPMFRLIPGVEVSTVEGHVLALGVSTAPPAHRPLAETLDWIRDQGGVSSLAHPFRWSHGVGRAAAETARCDAIETMNGHNGPIPNAKAELIAARRGLAATGGSDSHGTAGLGRTFTEFEEGLSTVEDILEALRRGRATAAGKSLGPVARVRGALAVTGRRVLRGFRPI
jgi:predicted metal-dependent phosphoesterase TrpH